MRVSRLVTVCLAMTAAVAAVRDSRAATGQSPPAQIGVYSTAQADRGAEVYRRACAACHKPDLQGDADNEVPALVDGEFLGSWERLSVGDLMTRVSRTMPGNRPGSLTRREYLDIVAFLLRSNRFPSGPGELPGDDATLSTLSLKQE
jgi:mono/diheme cytochrome c family protein